MTYPLAMGASGAGPRGLTYASVLVRAEGPPDRDDVLALLRRVRFTGWLGPVEEEWLVAVAAAGAGTVAAGRRGVVDVGAWLAEQVRTTVVAVRVVDDRQLLLAVWADGAELGRYVSDPSYGLGPDDDTLPDPLGAEHAEAFAAACGRPDVGGPLAELLSDELAEDDEIESERLASVLRLLGLPRWLVAASALPRRVPTGPAPAELTRLRAGRSGPAGWPAGAAADVVRRRRRPASPVPEAPRGGPDLDPWLM